MAEGNPDSIFNFDYPYEGVNSHFEITPINENDPEVSGLVQVRDQVLTLLKEYVDKYHHDFVPPAIRIYKDEDLGKFAYHAKRTTDEDYRKVGYCHYSPQQNTIEIPESMLSDIEKNDPRAYHGILEEYIHSITTYTQEDGNLRTGFVDTMSRVHDVILPPGIYKVAMTPLDTPSLPNNDEDKKMIKENLYITERVTALIRFLLTPNLSRNADVSIIRLPEGFTEKIFDSMTEEHKYKFYLENTSIVPLSILKRIYRGELCDILFESMSKGSVDSYKDSIGRLNQSIRPGLYNENQVYFIKKFFELMVDVNTSIDIYLQDGDINYR